MLQGRNVPGVGMVPFHQVNQLFQQWFAKQSPALWDADQRAYEAFTKSGQDRGDSPAYDQFLRELNSGSLTGSMRALYRAAGGSGGLDGG